MAEGNELKMAFLGCGGVAQAHSERYPSQRAPDSSLCHD